MCAARPYLQGCQLLIEHFRHLRLIIHSVCSNMGLFDVLDSVAPHRRELVLDVHNPSWGEAKNENRNDFKYSMALQLGARCFYCGKSGRRRK